jgi:hypothetical protein
MKEVYFVFEYVLGNSRRLSLFYFSLQNVETVQEFVRNHTHVFTNTLINVCVVLLIPVH